MKPKVLFLVGAASLIALIALSVERPRHAAVRQTDPEPVSEVPHTVPVKDRATVRKGLDYLAARQQDDGHWEGDDGRHPVAVTGRVGLALLLENNLGLSNTGRFFILHMAEVRKGTYSPNVRKAADWLMDHSHPRTGLIHSSHPSETSRYMDGHGMATLFLAGALREEADATRRKRLTDVLTRAVHYIVAARSTQGGWHHTSTAEGHDFDTVAATVLQVQALQAAWNAGITVPSEVLPEGLQYLNARADQDPENIVDIAATLACTYLGNPQRPASQKSHHKWFNDCAAKIPMGEALRFGRDELAHYYYAQAIAAPGRALWDSYSTALFEHLWNTQNPDGSWPVGDGSGLGAVEATAVWCTVILLSRDSHPAAHGPVLWSPRAP